MKTKIFFGLLLFSFSILSFAEVRPNTTAPDFTISDMNAKTHKLSDFKGKWIVMEWFNKDCPFVKKHYGSNNMQTLQKTYTDKGVIWLTVYSSAKGNQGHQEPRDAISTQKELKGHSSFLLADNNGAVGKLYGAVTTPHMFIISPDLKVVYTGAIDDNNSPDPAVIAGSKNYVALALDEAMANKTVTIQNARPYGCSVKY